MADLVPDLQHILFWMSNSIELLYFLQQKCPLYMQSMEEELDVTGMALGVPWSSPGLGQSWQSCGFMHTCLQGGALWAPGQWFGMAYKASDSGLG